MDIATIIIIAIFVLPLGWVLWAAVMEYRKTQQKLMVGDEKAIRKYFESASFGEWIGGLIVAGALFGPELYNGVPAPFFVDLPNKLGFTGRATAFGIGVIILWLARRDAKKANDAKNKQKNIGD